MIDSQGRKWEVMEREDGSVVCYYTREGESAHWIVWDSLDAAQQSKQVDALPACPTCGHSLSSGTTPKDGRQYCPVCGAILDTQMKRV